MKATINGIALNYEISGAADAPPVILHHPLATNLSTWNELTPALQSDYRVIRFDARGHGISEAPKGAYTFETLAQDVVGLMDHLGIDKASYLGLSMGGMVGQYLGLLHPSRFHSLCLVSTTTKVPAEARPLWDERIRNAGTKGMVSVVEGSMPRWFAPETLATKSELVAGMKDMILSTPPDGYIGWCHAIGGLDVTARLEAIALPTLIIAGELDPGTPPAAAEVIQRRITGSRLVVMPRVSHMLHVEEPATFASHVKPFLAAHGGGG